MFLTKLKLAAAALWASACAALMGGPFTSLSVAQVTQPTLTLNERNFDIGPTKAVRDADFIRRISKDLRGADPTPLGNRYLSREAFKENGGIQKRIVNGAIFPNLTLATRIFIPVKLKPRPYAFANFPLFRQSETVEKWDAT